MAQAIQSCLEGLGIDAVVTVNVGIAEREPDEHVIELLERARARTAHAKAAGQNLVVGRKPAG